MSARPRVLLTGASGFTGPYVRDVLESAGYDVIGIGLRAPGSDLTCDLSAPEEVSSVVREVRPRKVLHLGGVSFVGEEALLPFYTTNVLGTHNLLKAISALPDSPDRVVLASSANVYGSARSGRLTETLCPMPVNHYAISKLAAEHVATMFRHRLNITVTRPFNYTGIGQDQRFLIPKIVAHFRKRMKRIRLGNIDVLRDFSDVRDVAQAYLRLLDADIDVPVVNLCSGRVYSVRNIIEMLIRLSGHDIEIERDPDLLRENEIDILQGDRSLLETSIGPLPIRDLSETLEWMYAA
jgi:nucleoside-diphosphate-sugar epimerase